MKFRAFSPQGFGQIQKEQFIGNMYTFKFFGVVVFRITINLQGIWILIFVELPINCIYTI